MTRTLLCRLSAILSMLVLGFAAIAQQNKPILDWQHCIGGTQYDAAASVIKTFDNSYVVLGSTQSSDGDVNTNHGGIDCYVVKLSPSGNIIWKQSLGGTAFDYGTFIQQTSDSGFIVAAYSQSSDGDVNTNHGLTDAWIIKLSSQGNIQWQKTYGGSKLDVALCVRQTFDGGYLFAGWSASTDGDLTSNKGGEDCWAVKLDTSGNITWQKSFGGSLEDHFSSLIQTTDSNYLFVDGVKSNDGDVIGQHGSDDYWVVRVDKSGNMIWQKTLGGSGTDHCGDHGITGCVEQTHDGDFIISGWSNSTNGDVTGNHGNYDAWIVRLSNTGNIVWEKSLGGSGDDEALYLTEMPDSSIIAAGITNSTDGDVDTIHGLYDVWVFKLSKSDSLLWEQSFGGPSKEIAFALDRTSDTSVILAGYTGSNIGQVSGYKGGISDMWVLKLDMPNIINSTGDIKTEKLVAVPNPGKGIITVYGNSKVVKLKLYNLNGQLIGEKTGNELNFSGQPDGIYILRVYDLQNMLLMQQKVIKR